ncbi:M1 family metallopeptidase, partial [Luteimonas aquatica]|uniref:M1 family metallopeptidase n=1 Tax=Luteimonas aquatica TaxID=450364 RepID=UPI001F5A42A5
FRRTEALPSYLIAFAVGPWDVVQGQDAAPGAVRAAPLKIRALATRGQGGRMRYTLANTPRIVAALEQYFGTPFPFEKLDSVAAPDFGGAMENAGLVVYNDVLLTADERSSVRQRDGFWIVGAHELAHQWFGNLVTSRWWDDLWLNEGFSNWMGAKIYGQLQAGASVERDLLEETIQAMEIDSLASTRRIHEPIGDYTDIDAAFDDITYSKGAATLQMFENYLGPEKFRDGIRDYLRTHARGTATSADLIAAVAARSDRPDAVGRAFSSFIDQAGVPLVQVDVECGRDRPALLLRQARYLPIGSGAAASQRWGIPVAVRYADAGTVREQKVLFEGARMRVELQQAQGCPAWVMPNAHAAGYYRFGLSPQWQRALASAFGGLDALEQRSYADSVIAAYDAGKLTPSQLIEALPGFVRGIASATVTAGTDRIDWMDRHLFGDEAARSAFRAGIAEIYRPTLDKLGLRFRDGESDETRKLRKTLMEFHADTLHERQVRAALRTQGRAVLGLDGDGRLHPDGAPRDIRGLALRIAVEEGGKEAFDSAERHLRAAQETEIRLQLLQALGSASDPALAERVRALALEPDLVRRTELYDLLKGQADDPRARQALRGWLERHFDGLNARVSPAGAGLVALYAQGMCSQGDATQLRERFAARLEHVEAGPLTLKQAVENIQMCAAQVALRRRQAPAFTQR